MVFLSDKNSTKQQQSLTINNKMLYSFKQLFDSNKESSRFFMSIDLNPIQYKAIYRVHLIPDPTCAYPSAADLQYAAPICPDCLTHLLCAKCAAGMQRFPGKNKRAS